MTTKQFLRQTILTIAIALPFIASASDSDNVIYLVGTPTDWVEPSEANEAHYANWTLPETYPGSHVYERIFDLPAQPIFRFYSALTGWDGGDSYGSQVVDTPIPITIYDGDYQVLDMVQGKGSWEASWDGGLIKITVNMTEGNYSVILDTYDTEEKHFTVDGISYEVTSTTTASIIGGELKGDVVIPGTITNGNRSYTVTAFIGGDSFNTEGLTSITFPASIENVSTSIAGTPTLTAIHFDENNAKYSSIDGVWFNKEKTILIEFPRGKGGDYVVPDGVEDIGLIQDFFDGYFYSRPFKDASEITSITYPASVKRIPEGQSPSYIAGCNKLKEIIVAEANEVYSSQDGVLFCKDKRRLITCPPAITGDYVIPDCVKEIAAASFNETQITSVTIGKNIEQMSTPFINCPNLTTIHYNAINCEYRYIGVYITGIAMDCPVSTVNFGQDVKVIPYYLLAYFDDLTSVVIPDNVETIYANAFVCDNLESIKIGSGCLNLYGAIESRSLHTIEVDPANTAYMAEDNVLFNKEQTTLILFPAARSGNYTIPTAVTTIGWGAFNYSQLSEVEIPMSVTKIEGYAFMNAALTAITIPESVTTIEERAFEGTALTSIVLPNSVNSMGTGAFSNCTNLERVVLPRYIKNIPSSTFHSCTALKEVTIPDSVTVIGDYAFSWCQSLESIVIPASVDTIGNIIFDACDALRSIVSLNPTPPHATGYNYLQWRNATLYVPAGSGEAYRNDAEWGQLAVVEGAATNITISKNIENAGIVEVPSSSSVGVKTTINAVAAGGYKFIAWHENGVILSSEPTYTFTAALSHHIMAEFAPVTDNNNIEVNVAENTATLVIAAEENVVSYIAHIYSDADMTQLVATQEYDAQGNLITRSGSVSITFEGLENGNYYYELIAENAEGNIMSKYCGSFVICHTHVVNPQDRSTVITTTTQGIRILNANGKYVAVYDLNGRCIIATAITSNDVVVNANKGIYLVLVNDKVYKVKC